MKNVTTLVALYEIDEPFTYHEDPVERMVPDSAPHAVFAVVDQVLADFDGARCPSCATPIGGLLDEDDYSRPRSRWVHFWVAHNLTTGAAWPLCEDCTVPFDPPTKD